MDLRHLRTLLDVVDLGSFAAAARLRDQDPSWVSRAVAALEAELGVRLLQRNTRRLALSEAGEAYVREVRAVLDRLDHAGDEARATSGEVRGTVRLTTTVAFGQTLVAQVLPALHAAHPALELEMVLTDQVVDLVTERIDLAIRLGPPVDSDLVGVRLARLRYCVCASPAYLERHGRPTRPADLTARACLRFALPGFRTLWKFRDATGETHSVEVKGWLVLSSALALQRAALEGLGPVLLSHWLVDDDLRAGRLVNLFPDHEVSATDFDSAAWLLYPSRDFVPKRVRAVIDVLKDCLGE